MSDTEEMNSAANPWDSVGVEPDLAADGIWVDDFMVPGWRVRIRSISSQLARRAQDKMFAQRRSIITANAGMVPTEIRDRMDAELCRVLVVDWQNIPLPSDPKQMMPCTPENIMSVATHPKFGPAFRQEVLFVANNQASFRADTLAEISKN